MIGIAAFLLKTSWMFQGVFLFQSVIISGVISDRNTNVGLPGAYVVNEQQNKSVASNSEGWYSIQLSEQDSVSLEFRFLGYEKKKITISGRSSVRLDISLFPEVFEFDEVLVLGNSVPINKRTQMSYIQIPAQSIASIPAFMGQTDVLKSIQFLPGVSAGIEGSAGFYVRGGSIDQSLVLFDGAPIYHAYHAGGFVSTFQPMVIQNLDFFSGGFPSKFGDRLSSVVDVSVKNGRSDKIGGEINVGLMTAEFVAEGPLVKGKQHSFLLAARHSTFSGVANFFEKENNSRVPANPFYDITAKAKFAISPSSIITTSLYIGNDELDFSDVQTIKDDELTVRDTRTNIDSWGNTVFGTRWLYYLGMKTSLTTQIYLSNYRNSTERGVSYEEENNGVTLSEFDSSIETSSKIIDAGFKSNITYNANNAIRLHTGFESKLISVRPLIRQQNLRDDTLRVGREIQRFTGDDFLQMDYFFSSEITLWDRLTLHPGARISYFIFQEAMQLSPQYRMAVSLELTKKITLKASYSDMVQPIHRLSTSAFGVANDLWVASTDNFLPEEASIWAVGFGMAIRPDLELSVEYYKKDMRNLLEYQQGTSFLDGIDSWEEVVTSGSGRSEGVEVFLNKKYGRFTGWLSYTYSRTFRSFDEIMQGQEFPFQFDRPHIANLTAAYKISKSFKVSTGFVYTSGFRVTMPNSRMPSEQFTPFYSWNRSILYSGKNNYKLPDFHRLDLSFTYSGEFKVPYEATIGAYNLYNKFNPVGLSYVLVVDSTIDNSSSLPSYGRFQYLFGIIPFASLKITL